MAKTTKRRFTDEFKREAVALWERSGRPQTEVASELGIMPMMLRRWQRKLQEGGVPVTRAAKPPVSTMASPADQASEMERDILKNGRGFGPPVRGRNGSWYGCCRRVAADRLLVA